jgi:hypothetical protein
MNMPHHEERIKARALMGISILFENDVYELARFVVKIHHAQDEEANLKSGGTRQESRSTLLGLAHKYAYLTNISSDKVKDAIKRAGLSLGTTIEDDSP